jgi:HK97 family phage portal protein
MHWREAMTATCILRGNAYSQIARRASDGQAVAVYPIKSDAIRRDRNASGQLVWIVKDGNQQEKSYTVDASKPHDIFHLPGLSFDGVEGHGVVSVARHSIGNGLAAQHHQGAFFGRGGRIPYVLEAKTRFKTDADFETFSRRWEEKYSDPSKSPILEGDMTYKQIGLSLRDSQFVESQQWSVPDICRWFLMDPVMIGDLSKATYNNSEQKFLEFLTLTLMGWLVRWEHAIRRCLLTPEQQAILDDFKAGKLSRAAAREKLKALGLK